jgi:hypothetical protein
MTQELSQQSMIEQLTAIKQLLTHIQQSAIDSENTPIVSAEVPSVVNLIVQRLVLQHPHLDQIIQEILDDLRFNF